MNATHTKERILDAAFAEFAEYGVAGARVDRIARTAGCNKNLIYVYFENKETLFTTVLQRHLTDTYAGIPFTPDDLPELARRVFDLAQTKPGIYRLLAWATLEGTKNMPAERDSAHAAKVAAIRERQVAGTMDATFPPELLIMATLTLATAWSSVFPFGSGANASSGLSDDTVREAIAEMVARLTGQSASGRER
jgi:AcrR family transcriptional regulator